MTSRFSKQGEVGYTWEEVLKKKAKVDDAHNTGFPYSKWEPAIIKPDIRGGYMVEITTKKI